MPSWSWEGLTDNLKPAVLGAIQTQKEKTVNAWNQLKIMNLLARDNKWSRRKSSSILYRIWKQWGTRMIPTGQQAHVWWGSKKVEVSYPRRTSSCSTQDWEEKSLGKWRNSLPDNRGCRRMSDLKIPVVSLKGQDDGEIGELRWAEGEDTALR